MSRVLLIEDERDLRQVLEYNLRQAGHEVLQASSGTEGLRLADEFQPELVLLDLMLPDLSGFEICKRLRSAPATRAIAVMMLTARGDEIDRVLGFELGADDYVVKPFSVRELLLRVQAVLKRGGQGSAAEGPGADEVIFGTLRFSRAAHRVWVEEREVELTALEFRLLALLHERRNRVQSRAALLSTVWGINAEIETRTVDTHVKRLREKLGSAGDYIETVRGVGYRFKNRPDAASSTEP